MILRADFKTDLQTNTHTDKHIFRIVYPLYFAKFLFSEIIDQRITILCANTGAAVASNFSGRRLRRGFIPAKTHLSQHLKVKRWSFPFYRLENKD